VASPSPLLAPVITTTLSLISCAKTASFAYLVFTSARGSLYAAGERARSPLAVDPPLHLRRIPVAPHLDARDGCLDI
jgi:hypothetical protein